jgi:hypothetical protein
MPNDPPPRGIARQRAQRRLAAGASEALVRDPRAPGPSAVVVAGSRTPRSTPEGGHRTGRDGAPAQSCTTSRSAALA